jgi:VanZ family protein
MKKYFFICISILIMIIIFKFSSEDAGESSRRSGIVLEFIKSLSSKYLKEDLLSYAVRKSAHFTIYFLLGSSLQLSFNDNARSIPNKFIVLAIVFLYACSDELHQSFIPGRSSEFGDVLIDSAGGLASIFIGDILRKISETVYRDRVKNILKGE